MKQPKRSRLWLKDGSFIRLRPQHVDHVWSYDFVLPRTEDARAYRALHIIDEFNRKCLATRVKRKRNSADVIDALTDLFSIRGDPACIRSEKENFYSLYNRKSSISAGEFVNYFMVIPIRYINWGLFVFVIL